MKLQKASREKVKLKCGISSASGFGKTYSALLMAHGFLGDWSKIAVIDTENGSASLYAHLGEYNTLPLDPPYTPERYMKAIDVCVEAGMELVIIDSISHEWEGEGGILDIHEDAVKKQNTRNSYTAWKNVTPRHQAFINKILYTPVHFIVTTRRKQAYEMVKDDRGRMSVQKLGTKEVQRDGLEYELTLNLEISNDKHYAQASKDRTELFADQDPFIITEETGKKLREWCEKGKEVPPKERPSVIYSDLLNSNASLFSDMQFDKWSPKPDWDDDRYKKGIPHLKKEIENRKKRDTSSSAVEALEKGKSSKKRG